MQQRQFMADASHELRTPVATARTAASVALQQPHRERRRVSRDARDHRATDRAAVADRRRHVHAGARRCRQLPDSHDPMYLDEVIDEVVRAAARAGVDPRRCPIELATSVPPRSPATRIWFGG